MGGKKEGPHLRSGRSQEPGNSASWGVQIPLRWTLRKELVGTGGLRRERARGEDPATPPTHGQSWKPQSAEATSPQGPSLPVSPWPSVPAGKESRIEQEDDGARQDSDKARSQVSEGGRPQARSQLLSIRGPSHSGLSLPPSQHKNETGLTMVWSFRKVLRDTVGKGECMTPQSLSFGPQPGRGRSQRWKGHKGHA